jgi:uncharacterized membrane protein YfcA
VQPSDVLLLAAGGLVAGVVNTLAGGGSLLTVPLLVMLGLPGPVANGTNRVGVAFGSGVATWRLASLGVSGVRDAAPLVIPSALGALLGAYGVVQLPAALFERIFGVLMLVLLVPILRGGRPGTPLGAREAKPRVASLRAGLRPACRATAPRARSLPTPLRFLAFFAIGLYGGAFQAGVGVLMLSVFSLAGVELVRSTHIKNALNTCFTLLALPIFWWAGQILWPQALALGSGFAAGGALGARVAVRGGERVIKPVLAVAVVALAGRMLGLYG